MDKFKNYIILGLSIIVMILLLLKGCEKPSVGKPTFIKGKEIVTVDTLYRPYKVIEFKPKFYPKWDTTYVDTSLTDKPFEKDYLVREYNDSTYDSNLTIFSKSKVIGIIKEQKLSYRLKVPLEVLKTTSRVDTLETIKPSKWSLYGGLESGGNRTQFNISPFLTLNARKASMTFRYGVLDKSYNIGVGIRILKSRK